MKTVEYPDKLYFSIGEVSKITGLEAHVLRFWESEFSSLKPKKNKKGQRTYQKKDIELILRIKKLLYEKKFTIKGATAALKSTKGPAEKSSGDDDREFLLKVHHELKMLDQTLKGSKSTDLFGD